MKEPCGSSGCEDGECIPPTCQNLGHECCDACEPGTEQPDYDSDCSPQLCCGTCETPEIPDFTQYIEAEAFTLTSPMVPASDSNASGGQYIHAPEGTGDTTNPTAEATYSIDIPSTGDYYLWLLMYGPTEANDALYIGFNGDFDRVFPSQILTYEWVETESEHGSGDYIHTLTEGPNVIQISHGEELARADRVLVTNDPDLIPELITYHPADNDPQNGCVTMGELTAYIEKWLTGQGGVSMPGVMGAVNLWRQGTGCNQ